MSDLTRVRAFTGGRYVPSARFRVRQLVDGLLDYGFAVEEWIPRIKAYPPKSRWRRPGWLAGAILERLPAVLGSYRADMVVMQRELISTLKTLEPLTRRPRILDVDDAIFLYRGGKFARSLAEGADLVVCGNQYLAEWFGRWARRVETIPTAVDTDTYVPVSRAESRPTIGWIGTSGNARYLRQMAGSLTRLLRERPDVMLKVISDRPPELPGMDSDQIVFEPWSPQSEVSAIQGMTIGIMPLADTEWSRGKCSFKMLQYMSCGLPVVVAPVGMNAEVLEMGEIGLAAQSEGEWYDALMSLLTDPEMAASFGRNGRRIVESEFSLAAVTPRVAAAWRSVL